MAPGYDRFVKGLIALTAAAMSLYHVYVALTGAPQALFFRGTHLLFAMALVFLLYPSLARRKTPTGDVFRDDAGGTVGGTQAVPSPSWLDWLCIAASAVTIIYIWVNHERLITRFVYVEDPETIELVLGVLFTVLVLDATRRIIGWALPITAIIFLAYASFIAKVRPEQIIEILYLTTEGIFGTTLGVSASYVIMFVLFGAFMERTGVGQAFHGFCAVAHRVTPRADRARCRSYPRACSVPSREARWPTCWWTDRSRFRS